MSEQGDNSNSRPPKRYTVGTVTVVAEQDVQVLFKDALSVVADEIMRFKKTSNKGKPLTLGESRVLQGYIKCLVELSKEKRETADSQDLANLSNDELLSMISKLKGNTSGEESA